MNYKALNDFIILEKTEEEKSNSNFVIVDKKSTLLKGKVISSNNEKIKEGSLVLYPNSVGLEIENNLLAIKEEHIICEVDNG